MAKDLIEKKAKAWDKLAQEIENMYINPATGEEWTEEETEAKGYDLTTIGEAAATAFGWL